MKSGALAGVEDDGEPRREVVRVRRRQERSAQTREKILDAASKEFATAGFGGATTRSIADRADVQHGLVIYHFQTKLGVWEAATARVLQGFRRSMKAALDGLEDVDDVAKLRSVLRDMVRTIARTPEVSWLMSHEINKPSQSHWLTYQIIGRELEVIFDLIRKAQAASSFVEGDPKHLYYLYLGAASRVFMAASEIEGALGQSPFEEAFIERHADLCGELFFRTPPARSRSRRARGSRTRPD